MPNSDAITARPLLVFTILQIFLSLYIFSCVNGEPASDTECAPISAKQSEIWTYHCINNQCKRLMTNEYIKKDENICQVQKRNLTSYQACKLFCGDSTGTLWPLPTGNIVIGGPAVPISHKDTEIVIKFDTSEDVELKSKELFNNVTKYFKEKISKKYPENLVEKRSISSKLVITGIISKPNHISLDLKTDEGYSIKLEHDRTNEVKAFITSDNFYGLRHGFQTISQLIVYDDIEKFLIMPWKIDITDRPAYPIRGLTLDTSRNFIKIKSIKRTIDAMAENKLNIFHWHITDTHSFPLVLPNNRNFAKFGAYGTDKVYKPKEVKELVQYARIRGVKIVPEFDAPAHVGYGWQWIPSQLVVCLDEQPWPSYCVEAPCGQLDPTQEILYQKLYSIYSDMFELFDVDNLFHMGGDEVHFQCWNKTESIVQWMKDRGWKTDDDGFLQLWNYFQQRALENVMSVSAKFGKANSPDIILWTSHLTTGDALDNYVDQNKYIIQIWTKGLDPNVGELLKKGYRVIFSNYDALYFDCGFGSWVGEGNNWCSPYIPWQKIYGNDPYSLAKELIGGNSTKEDLKKQILGQIATLWTEQVEDLSMDSRFWPRASAMAERTWSDPSTDWKKAEYRFLYQRNRLVEQLGIAADGQEPLFCSLNEGSCPMEQS